MAKPTWMIILFALFVVLAPSSVLAGTLNVNTTTDENGSGASCSLREAIKAANETAASFSDASGDGNFGGCTGGDITGADTINLPAGTYTVDTANDHADARLLVTSTITLTGAGSASTTIRAATTCCDSDYRVFRQESGTTLTLSGVTIRHGNGGIYSFGNLVLNNDTVITANAANFSGVLSDAGGVYSQGTLDINPTVTISGNTADGVGGGIYTFATSTTISGAIISGNTASSEGGGIAVGSAGGVTIDGGTQIFNNTANGSGGGGGIYTGRGLTISGGSQITNNHAPNGRGGGIRTTDVVLTISNTGGAVVIQDNTAGISGEGLASSTFSIISVTGACIVNNGDEAVTMTAVGTHSPAGMTGNWWGSSNGPYVTADPALTEYSLGDSVTDATNIDFSGWLTSAPASCKTCAPVSAVDRTARTCS